jgi:transposase
MGYRRMDKDDLYNVFRRWRGGYSISSIANATGSDRKTVRQYIGKFTEAGLSRQGPALEKEALYEAFSNILPATERAQPAREELQSYEKEIRRLIQDDKEPVKPKTAYRIIRAKYKIRASYVSFKRFVRAKGLSVKPTKRVLRIELPAAQEMQIDYGRVGLLEDSFSRKNRVVWAFCAILSFSRLPFIQFVYTQKQESFADSFIDALEFYEGSTEFVSLDNLKAGVIKPDLWDPKLNKSFAETADYYGVFINPCRVAKGTDKGKVERIIPLARELFRMLKHIYPSADLRELNRQAKIWCCEDYGQNEHGTTGIPPMQAYETVERALLTPLPAERFEIPVWKTPKVHRGDGFFIFDGKRYAGFSCRSTNPRVRGLCQEGQLSPAGLPRGAERDDGWQLPALPPGKGQRVRRRCLWPHRERFEAACVSECPQSSRNAGSDGRIPQRAVFRRGVPDCPAAWGEAAQHFQRHAQRRAESAATRAAASHIRDRKENAPGHQLLHLNCQGGCLWSSDTTYRGT